MTEAKVKQLDWHNFDAWTHWAEAVCGTYHVEERNGWWQVELRVGGLVHVVAVTDDTLPADLEAAQAAAQADNTARILAALEPAALTPNPVDDSQTADPAVNELDDDLYDLLNKDIAPPNEKLRQMYADYRKAIDSGRLIVDAPLRHAERIERWSKDKQVNAMFREPTAPDLSDPVTVHANMLRGTIAKPTVEQIIHLYGVDVLAKALAPVIVREAALTPTAVDASHPADPAVNAPDTAAIRHSFDGHGWLYLDAGSGSDWIERGMAYPDAEMLYEKGAADDRA